MLVLSRKIDESIKIGEDVTVTVLEIRGDKVRLGIHAPSEVPVHRHEVWANIQAEKASPGSVVAVVGSAPLAAKIGKRN